MAVFLAYSDNQFDATKFIILWIVLVFVTILTINFKVERKNKQQIKTDKTGIFNSQGTLDFYEELLIIKRKVFERKSNIKYSQSYQVLESNDYFISYFNMNQAYFEK